MRFFVGTLLVLLNARTRYVAALNWDEIQEDIIRAQSKARSIEDPSEKWKEEGTRICEIPLQPSTGFNNVCGEPIIPRTPNAQFVALYNPEEGDPIELTPEVCESNPDGILATWPNEYFYTNIKGWPMPDRRLVNVPYNEVPVVVDLAGTREFVPQQFPQVAQPVPTHSAPNMPETLKDFLSVEGKLVLTCFKDGSAHAKVTAKNYAPNAVLTLWMVFQNNPGTNLPPVLPLALGGAPNVVTANSRGEFTFERDLNFCPSDEQNGGRSRVISIAVAKHLDGGNSYGNVPQNVLKEFTFRDPVTKELFKSNGIGPGMMTVDQGHFTIFRETLEA